MRRSRKKIAIRKDKKWKGYWRITRANWKLQIKNEINNLRAGHYDGLNFEHHKATVNEWDLCDCKYDIEWSTISPFKYEDNPQNYQYWKWHWGDHYIGRHKENYNRIIRK